MGYTQARYRLAQIYELQKNYKEAVRYYLPLAHDGYEKAPLKLAHLYKEGLGVEQDYKKAVKLYRKSIEQGYMEAQSDLDFLCNKQPWICKEN